MLIDDHSTHSNIYIYIYIVYHTPIISNTHGLFGTLFLSFSLLFSSSKNNFWICWCCEMRQTAHIDTINIIAHTQHKYPQKTQAHIHTWKLVVVVQCINVCHQYICVCLYSYCNVYYCWWNQTHNPSEEDNTTIWKRRLCWWCWCWHLKLHLDKHDQLDIIIIKRFFPVFCVVAVVSFICFDHQWWFCWRLEIPIEWRVSSVGQCCANNS